METVTVPVSFVKEAYKAACNPWKQKIRYQFPDLFTEPNFDVGQIVESDASIVLVTGEGSDSNRFSGVRLISKTSDKIVGEANNRFGKHLFTKYIGPDINIRNILKV